MPLIVSFQAISLVGAIEQQSPFSLNVGYWLRDPNQWIQWPELVASHPRQDFLWEQTCFEIFIGVQGEDFYREINLSPSQAWQAYQPLKNIVILSKCHLWPLMILN